MEFFEQVLNFILEHRGLLITLLVSILAIIKLTKWGKAHEEALETVIDAIEKLGAKSVKTLVATKEGVLSSAAQEVIRCAVAKVDPKKRPTHTVCKLRGLLSGKNSDKKSAKK